MSSALRSLLTLKATLYYHDNSAVNLHSGITHRIIDIILLQQIAPVLLVTEDKQVNLIKFHFKWVLLNAVTKSLDEYVIANDDGRFLLLI